MCTQHLTGLTAGLTLLCAMIFTGPPAKADGELAITIDDLPYVMPSRVSPDLGLKQVQNVVAALKKHEITATGFVVGGQITRDSRSALEAFRSEGHTLGNHSWSHPDLNEISRWRFSREVKRTHRALSGAAAAPITTFRFPYLHEGDTEKKYHAARATLDKLGYRNVPVTIDNDEWEFNAEYMDALDQGDKPAAARIAADYLEHMKERTSYFRRLAQETQGRDVKHILLIHMNQINADHLESLLDWYAEEDWRFIPVDEALKDPIYSAEIAYIGPKGLSQLERIAPDLHR